jgi:hypothetical protein
MEMFADLDGSGVMMLLMNAEDDMLAVEDGVHMVALSESEGASVVADVWGCTALVVVACRTMVWLEV